MSLAASEPGIQLAKLALKRRSLTQKALVNERGIASWSTVNRFFNGKPINRNIFIDLCNELDLNWEEVVIQPNEATDQVSVRHTPSVLLNSVLQCAIATRKALSPRILEPIPRSVIQHKYLPAIDRGVTGGHQRIISIIAPAGYGKSTILGNLYDELIHSKCEWVGLALCSNLRIDVMPSTQSLAIALGETISGTQTSILEITEHLTNHHGRGVLLIDTLDLVISRGFVSAFNPLLRSLLDLGVTIVFTCRDHEYNDFLEPTREKLAGIAERVDRHSVPGFTSAEIREAAETFFHKREPDSPDHGRTFADNILALSADNRSLLDITQNPLLLALLCDLFAEDGNVPPDLTVSKLYQRYWAEKIAHSRVDDSRSSLLAIEKDNLCLAIARSLFHLSIEKLCESAYRDELDIQFTETTATAYDDLLSEGVLDRLPSQKIHFFHQTLLEYAIAYWLTRRAAQAQRDQLLVNLREPEASYQRTYWLPILRQHLVIVDSEEEFEALVNQLNTDDMGIFGAVALAAASRQRSTALLNLLPTALKRGEAHQRRLRQALESASRPMIEESWEILLSLLEQAEHATAANTAQMVGALLSRWWQLLKTRLPETLDKIAQRQLSVNHQVHQDKDDRSLLFGWLLQPCLLLLREQPDPDLLETLRNHYTILGYKTCAAVIGLHRLPSVSISSQQLLLAQMLRFAVPNDAELEKEITTFVVAQLPLQLTQVPSPLGSHWSDILYNVFPKGWDIIQARAVGQWATQHSTVLAKILEDLCTGETHQFRRNFIAIDEAIRHGASPIVTQLLVKTPIQDLSSIHFTALARFIKSISSALAPTDQEWLAQWLQPFAEEYTQDLLPIFDALADHSPTARQSTSALIERLPLLEQVEYRVKQLRFLPTDQHPLLETFDKPAQLWLARYYRVIADSDSAALDRLLTASQSKFKDVAVASCYDLDKLSASLAIAQMLPLLKSRFPGVRSSGLSVIKVMNYKFSSVDDSVRSVNSLALTNICTILMQEDNQVVARVLCELVSAWVRKHQQVPSLISEAICGITPRLVARNSFDGGIARVMISALKAIAQTEATNLDPQFLSRGTRDLLLSINIIKVQNSEAEMIDLLSAVCRLNQFFLAEIVLEDCPILSQQQWLRNVYAVIKTIRRVEGQGSTLLDEILSSDWCTAEIRSIILEVRGV